LTWHQVQCLAGGQMARIDNDPDSFTHGFFLLEDQRVSGCGLATQGRHAPSPLCDLLEQVNPLQKALVTEPGPNPLNQRQKTSVDLD
jgi:hypothetical protein